MSIIRACCRQKMCGYLVSVQLLFTMGLASDTSTYTIPCPPCTCFMIEGRINADCQDRNLSSIPSSLPANISYLNLALNHIDNMTTVEGYTNLLFLNMSFNDRRMLSRDSFSRLPSLESLDLQGNHLNLSTEVFPEGLFRSQKKLLVLLIQKNSDVFNRHDYPDRTFQDLTSLQELHIDGSLNATFGEGFEQMGKLSNLSFDGNCNIRFITNRTFLNVPNLQFLNISKCNLLHIELSAFEPVGDLVILDVSDNVQLGVAVACRAMYGLRNSSLKILRANRLQPSKETGILVKADDTKYMKNMKLEELFIDRNRIEIFEPDVLLNLPPTLRVISLEGNFLYYGNYMIVISAMTGLRRLYLTRQHEFHFAPFSSDASFGKLLSSIMTTNTVTHRRLLSQESGSINSFHNSGINNVNAIKLHIPPNLEYFDVSFSTLQLWYIDTVIFAKNKLKYVDVSNNFITRWEGPLLGLQQLEYFDLSYNFCGSLSDKFFSNYNALRILNVSGNLLAYTLTNNSFTNLTKLEVLNLASNKIQHLPRKIFENVQKLKTLNISSNFIYSWNVNINNMLSLEKLDLSNNLLSEVPDEVRVFTSNYPNLVTSLYLKGNPLKCTCETLASLKWIQGNKHRIVGFDHLYCETAGHSQQYFRTLDHLVVDLQKDCASYLGIMAGVLSIVMLCIGMMVSGLVYRYRWKLRYLYYLARIKHRGFLPIEDDGDFDYDAFISYADEDRGLVVSEMRTRLEDNKGLRLCIHHRDFLPGNYIADNILNAIKTSRKTVVILSRNFLKSEWCRYEAEMARMENIYSKRNTLLVVVLEKIPVKDLTRNILDLMNTESYVEYTEDETGREVFWENLYRGIASS